MKTILRVLHRLFRPALPQPGHRVLTRWIPL